MLHKTRKQIHQQPITNLNKNPKSVPKLAPPALQCPLSPENAIYVHISIETRFLNHIFFQNQRKPQENSQYFWTINDKNS